jgi:hypothetical protein
MAEATLEPNSGGPQQVDDFPAELSRFRTELSPTITEVQRTAVPD